MTRTMRLVPLAAIAALALAGPSIAGATTPPPAAPGPATLRLAETSAGQVITDANGMAIYLFIPDKVGVTTCFDECLAKWPSVPGPSSAGQGVDAALLGAAERSDTKAMQASYNGWPLYTFAGDLKAGDTTGQAVGGKWFVIDAKGALIGAPAAATAPTTAGTTAATTAGTTAPTTAGTTAATTAATTAGTTAATTAGAAASTPAGGTTGPASSVAVATTALGDILVDGSGMTLYAFLPDMPTTSVCLGECLAKWPAVVGPATAETGLDAAKLGTVVRTDDSTTQATYNGWPLYYFAGDLAAGDIAGQGLGGVWYLLDAAGQAVGRL